MRTTFQAPVPLFHVSDMEASLAFYRDVLGFEMVSVTGLEASESDDPAWAMVRAGDLTLMLQGTQALTQLALPDAARNRCHADTVLYVVCADLPELCSHLRSIGVVTTEGSPVFANMEQVFLRDPDGYTLCFQRPRGLVPPI